MRVGTLFSGIGGFDVACERAGMSIAWQVERDTACLRVLNRHWPGVPKFDDVNTVGAHNLSTVDVICAGWPCQDLSVAGLRGGLAAERSGLFYEFARIANELRPAFLVWENVPGLLSSGNGRDFARVLNELDKIGYCGAWTMLDSRFFGVAQRRQRIFGVFALKHIGAECCAEILSLTSRVRWNPEKSGTKRPDATGNASSSAGGCADLSPILGKESYSPMKSSSGQMVDFAICANNFGERAVSTALSSKNQRIDADTETFVIAATLNSGGNSGGFRTEPGEHLVASFDPRNVTSNANRTTVEYGAPANTLHQGGLSIIKPQTVRRLTPTECERLQGYPDGWTAGECDTARYKMIGNAVTVNVVEWIAKRLAAA